MYNMRDLKKRQRKRTFGIYIGRFEPPHKAHLAVMLEAFENVQKLIIVLGSAQAARSTKNPFTTSERRKMIENMLKKAGIANNRVLFIEVRDYFYNEGLWLSEVQRDVQAFTQGSDDIVLIGHIKDESSYYLRSFPKWEFLPTQVESPLSATTVRHSYFMEDWETLETQVHNEVLGFLKDFAKTDEYSELQEEYRHLQAYRQAWQGSPYPPIFVTTDGVVVRSGHVLLVRRAGPLGRGRLAMPGGFVDQDETLLAGCMREIREETGLSSAFSLEQHLRGSSVFDYPDRSQRGRTITHAYYFDLGIGHLPDLRASSDAAAAFWMPLSEVLSSPALFFEDHHAIIEHFLMRG